MVEVGLIFQYHNYEFRPFLLAPGLTLTYDLVKAIVSNDWMKHDSNPFGKHPAFFPSMVPSTGTGTPARCLAPSADEHLSYPREHL